MASEWRGGEDGSGDRLLPWADITFQYFYANKSFSLTC